MKKILVDLSNAANTFNGIGHDSRLIFSMLAQSKDLEVAGLIYPVSGPKSVTLPTEPNAADFAGLIQETAAGQSRVKPKDSIEYLIKLWEETFNALRSRHKTAKIPEWIKTDALWRVLFDKSLPASIRNEIMFRDFYVTDLSIFQIFDRSANFSWLPDKALDVPDIDAIIFPMPRPIKVSNGAKRIFRYHDAITLTHADTAGGRWGAIKRDFEYSRKAASDGVFVCNSPMSQEDLLNVVPKVNGRSVVIPCAVQSVVSPVREDIRSILLRRLSLRAIGIEDVTMHRTDEFKAITKNVLSLSDCRFIISVSAIEPRKNFKNTILAWDQLRNSTKEDIRFVLVGSYGWHLDDSYRTMRPYVTDGSLLHVEALTPAELSQLYRGAEFCAFLSFAEGFGFAPLEALSVGTPSIVSDIPVFRWSLGRAAIFVDPYDVAEISVGMQRLLKRAENVDIREGILEEGKCSMREFSPQVIGRRWSDFLNSDLNELAPGENK